jgi:hypothetical protein
MTETHEQRRERLARAVWGAHGWLARLQTEIPRPGSNLARDQALVDRIVRAIIASDEAAGLVVVPAVKEHE